MLQALLWGVSSAGEPALGPVPGILEEGHCWRRQSFSSKSCGRLRWRYVCYLSKCRFRSHAAKEVECNSEARIWAISTNHPGCPFLVYINQMRPWRRRWQAAFDRHQRCLLWLLEFYSPQNFEEQRAPNESVVRQEGPTLTSLRWWDARTRQLRKHHIR